jgi:hypothetical protein
MTSLMGAKKRAEEFARAVDGRTEQTGLSVETTELVGLVEALRTQPRPEPRPEFSAALRERLLAEAEETLAQDAALTLPPRRRGVRERRLALLASSFVLVGGSAGMAAAAQNSLPGDALYPIKRGLENAQVDLSGDSTGKGRDLLDQAQVRLTEVRGLLDDSSDLHQVPSTLDDFTRQAQEGSGLLLRAYSTDHDQADVTTVRTFTQNALATLQEAAKTAPSEHQDELTDAALALLKIDERATDACPSCAGSKPALQMPTLFLTAAEADRAMRAVREKTIDNSHPALAEEPPAKPAKKDQQPPSSSTGDGGSLPTTGDSGTGDDTGSLPLPGTGGSGDTSGGGAGDLPGKVKSGAGDTVDKVGKAGKDAAGDLEDQVDGILNGLLP